MYFRTIKEANTFGEKKKSVEPKLYPLPRVSFFSLYRKVRLLTYAAPHSPRLLARESAAWGSTHTLTSSPEFQEHREPRHREATERARGRTSRNRNTRRWAPGAPAPADKPHGGETSLKGLHSEPSGTP